MAGREILLGKNILENMLYILPSIVLIGLMAFVSSDKFLEIFLLVLTMGGMLITLIHFLKKYWSPKIKREMTYEDLQDEWAKLAIFICLGTIYFLGSFLITVLFFYYTN